MSDARAQFQGKTAFITGAARGLGRALALALAEAGAHVIALARTVGALEELDDEIRRRGARATLIPADLADAATPDFVAAAIAGRFAALDIFIANAAHLGELSPLPDTDEKSFAAAFAVNVRANWRLLKGLDPLLRAAPAARVAVISDRIGGADAQAFWGHYGASKAALEHLARTYALEMQRTSVRVAIVDPGPMATRLRMQAAPGLKAGDLPDPESAVPLVLSALSANYDAIAARLVQPTA